MYIYYAYTCCIGKFVLNLEETNNFCLAASNNEGSRKNI